MNSDERGAATVTRARPRRGHGDDGAAVVEFALVGSLLFLLIFGIIAYGWAMGVRQNLVQAAAEGARAGAVAPSGQAATRAEEAVNNAAGAFGSSCGGGGGLTCTILVGSCVNNASKQCVTVTLEYDYENHSRMANVPVFGAFLPDTMETESVAEVN